MPAASNAISYTLTVDGAPVASELIGAIQSIQVEDHADLADMLRIKLAIGVSDDGSRWNVIDDDVFRRLTPVRLTARFGSASEPLIEAYVVETGISYSAQPGQSILTVVAMEPTVLLNLDEKVRRWPDMSDSDIAATVFGEYGFDTRITDTQPSRSEDEQATLQRGTDMQFLQQLATRNGYQCFVELNPASGTVEGHFHPPETTQRPQGTLTVNMGDATNVNSFDLRFDMLKPAVASVKNVDVATREDQPADVDSQSAEDLGSGAAVPSDRPRRVLLSRTGLSKAGELQALAQSVVDRSSWAVSAEGELSSATYGAVLRAKRPVNVRGVGRQFSGTWFVERVLHTFTGEGYVQRFTLRRNATGVTGQETFAEDNAL